MKRELKSLQLESATKKPILIELTNRVGVANAESITHLKDTISGLLEYSPEMRGVSKGISVTTTEDAKAFELDAKIIRDVFYFTEPPTEKIDFSDLLLQISNGELYYLKSHLMRINSPRKGYHEPVAYQSLSAGLNYCHSLAMALYEIFRNGLGRDFKQSSPVTQLGSFIFVEVPKISEVLPGVIHASCERMANVMRGYVFLSQVSTGNV